MSKAMFYGMKEGAVKKVGMYRRHTQQWQPLELPMGFSG